METRRHYLENTNRWVIKVGSSLLTKDGSLAKGQLKKYCRFIADLKKEKKQVVFVSSGAVASAHFRLPAKTKKNLPVRQALASLGQVHLMTAYQKYFSSLGIRIGQILLSEFSLKDRRSYLNAQETINYLLHLDCVPIVNENDPLATTELQFGDNDKLGALVAGLVKADLYLILSDTQGFFENYGEKSQKFISLVEQIDNKLITQARGPGKWGTGGMLSKILAAKQATSFGIPTLLMNGRTNKLNETVFKQESGTFFLPSVKTKNKRKTWLASRFNLKHRIIVDQGAAKVIEEGLASLLASGIVEVKGHFHAGDLCDVVSIEGKTIATGLVNHSSYNLKKIIGKKSFEIKTILGKDHKVEVIHKDNLISY